MSDLELREAIIDEFTKESVGDKRVKRHESAYIRCWIRGGQGIMVDGYLRDVGVDYVEMADSHGKIFFLSLDAIYRICELTNPSLSPKR